MKIIVLIVTVIILFGVLYHVNSMQSKFKVGDRVTVTGDVHMKGQKTGIVKMVEPHAYGIVFDNMVEMGVHKWYSQSELI